MSLNSSALSVFSVVKKKIQLETKQWYTQEPKAQ